MSAFCPVYLMDLDSELSPSAQVVERAIVFHALTSPSICLVEANMFDSSAIQALFASHLDLLLQTKNHRVPLFKTASRGGSSVLKGLDTLLSRGDPPKPAYLSSRDKAVNAAIRTNYDRLRTPEDRRDRLVQVIGESYRAHLGRLQQYFEENPTGTVHDVPRVVTPSLFDRVYSLAQFMVDKSRGKSLQPYVAVASALIEEIQRGKIPENRERLHRAIYGGAVVPASRGRVQRSERLKAADRACDEWRFIVNTHWGRQLTDVLTLDSAHHTNWFDLGRLGLAIASAASTNSLRKPERVKQVRLRASLDLADLSFAVSLRSTDEFWASLEQLEKARGTSDEQKKLTEWLRHTEYVTDRLAARLSVLGQRPQRTFHDVWRIPFNVAPVVGGLGVAVVVYFQTLDWKTAAVGGTVVERGLRGSFYAIDEAFGQKKVRSATMKAFVDDLQRSGRDS